MRNVIQLCLAANNILLMRKRNHAWYVLAWKKADRFASRRYSLKNKLGDRMIKQILNSVITSQKKNRNEKTQQSNKQTKSEYKNIQMDNLLSTVIRQWNLISMFNTSDENYRTDRILKLLLKNGGGSMHQINSFWGAPFFPNGNNLGTPSADLNRKQRGLSYFCFDFRFLFF